MILDEFTQAMAAFFVAIFGDIVMVIGAGFVSAGFIYALLIFIMEPISTRLFGR